MPPWVLSYDEANTPSPSQPTHTPMHPHTRKALHKVTNSSIKGDRPPCMQCLSPLTSPWQKNDNRSYRGSSGGKSQCKGSTFFFWGESTHWAGAHISKTCRNLVCLRLQINALLKNSLRLERCDISVIKYLCMCLHVLMTLRTCAVYTTALYHFYPPLWLQNWKRRFLADVEFLQ